MHVCACVRPPWFRPPRLGQRSLSQVESAERKQEWDLSPGVQALCHISLKPESQRGFQASADPDLSPLPWLGRTPVEAQMTQHQSTHNTVCWSPEGLRDSFPPSLQRSHSPTTFSANKTPTHGFSYKHPSDGTQGAAAEGAGLYLRRGRGRGGGAGRKVPPFWELRTVLAAPDLTVGCVGGSLAKSQSGWEDTSHKVAGAPHKLNCQPSHQGANSALHIHC